jgi:hypothetical protein
MWAAALTVFMIGGEAGSHAGGKSDERLHLMVSPTVAMAPALLRIQVYVNPAPDNRLLEIVAESDEYFRSSSIALEGARASRFHAVVYRSVPPGVYTVRAVLIGDDGEVSASAGQGVLVVG